VNRFLPSVFFLLLGAVNGYAQNPCARCHAAEVAAFAKSPMGQSIGAPVVPQDGRIEHKLSESTLTVSHNGEQVNHTVEHRGLSAEYPVAYSVGAGIVGFSYIVRIGQYLYQSPLSYYSQTKSWDLTPGYETERHPDFTHQITSGCLFCHTGSVNLVRGTTNQFENPPFTAISCERCHGSAAEHLKNPVPGSILNPSKLAGAKRDSVCEQCHLEGDARVLNPEKDWWDFQAGQPTENTFVTYLDRGNRDTLRAVSQSELLARSQCARQSGGRLWCGTCHDPHGEVTQNRPKQIQQVCLSCHNALFASGRHRPQEECVSCHMPRLRPTNVAHSAVTDHSIPRLPGQNRVADTKSELRAWREPADAQVAARALGMAYFDQASSTHDVSDLRKAYEILSRLPKATRQNDPPVEADLGSMLLAQGEVKTAVQLYAAAVAQQPSNARYAYCFGTALEQSGDLGDAVKEFRKSMELDPSQPDAYLALAELYKKNGRAAESQAMIREYLRFMPQNIVLRSSY
jgi:predicted CXXCH cytochrome family protein